jgi:superfamily I DNA/RNA helicase
MSVLQQAANPEQSVAIPSGSRHILVTAGPGTGKTYTLTQRLAALLAAGHDPERMAAITFTVKAADEVRERLLKSAGPAGERVFVGTFHQFCLDWLRRAAPSLAVVGPESRERLVLTASENRLWAGPSPRRLSRFIGEIPAQLLSASVAAPFRKAKGRKGSEQMELF